MKDKGKMEDIVPFGYWRVGGLEDWKVVFQLFAIRHSLTR